MVLQGSPSPLVTDHNTPWASTLCQEVKEPSLLSLADPHTGRLRANSAAGGSSRPGGGTQLDVCQILWWSLQHGSASPKEAEASCHTVAITAAPRKTLVCLCTVKSFRCDKGRQVCRDARVMAGVHRTSFSRLMLGCRSEVNALIHENSQNVAFKFSL